MNFGMRRFAMILGFVVGASSLALAQTHSETKTEKRSSGSAQASSRASASASAGGSSSGGGSSSSNSNQNSKAEEIMYQLVLDGMIDQQSVHNESTSVVQAGQNSFSEKSAENRSSQTAGSIADPQAAMRSAAAAGAYRMLRARIVPVVNPGVSAGEGWEKTLRPMLGRPGARIMFTFVGPDKVGSLNAQKVTFTYEEDVSAKTAAQAQGTFWIDPRSGWPLRTEMTVKGLSTQFGLLDAEVIETRIWPEPVRRGR